MTELDVVASRQVLRLSQDYFLKGARLIRETLDVDLGPALVFLTINGANFGNRSHPGEPPAPASIYSVSQSLGLPYETARRYAGVLMKSGVVHRKADGLVVAETGAHVPAVGRSVQITWNETALYVEALAAAGLALPDGRRDHAFDPPLRVSLLATLHFLRLLDILRAAVSHDLLSAVLFTAIIDANTEALRMDPSYADLYGRRGAIPPDDLRKPVSVTSLSERLGLPYETARRHARQLESSGLCDRVKGGYVAPASVLSDARYGEALEQVRGEASRFIESLAEVHPLPLRPVGATVEA